MMTPFSTIDATEKPTEMAASRAVKAGPRLRDRAGEGAGRQEQEAAQVAQRRKMPSERPRTHPNSRSDLLGCMLTARPRGQKAAQETGKFQTGGMEVGVYRGC
jgi:hypothetical protein